MELKSVEYHEHKGLPNEWCLQRIDFTSRNLIVGRNATGKSRTLRIIRAIAEMLCGKRNPTNGSWALEFRDDGDLIKYDLEVRDGRVNSEKLYRISGRSRIKLIDRDKDGSGRIRFNKSKTNPGSAVLVDFETPNQQIAAFAKQDRIQHPFLVSLVDWAKGVVFLDHSISAAREFTIYVDPDSTHDPDRQFDMGKTTEVYRCGYEEFGADFDSEIVADLNALGYNISEVGLEKANVKTSMPIQGVLLGLYVQERDLNCHTEHIHMSAGMYGALSVLVHLNYWIRKSEFRCFVVDDTGDGLDFSRSAALIEIVFKKSEKYGFQCIVASNDRFVMNAVPIDNWTVLQRRGHLVTALNSENSKEKFDEFRLTGLNNFDLLASDFLSDTH